MSKFGPPAPLNSVIGLVYLILLIAAFTYAYNANAKMRTLLGGKA